MQIVKDTVVTLDFTLKDDSGSILDTTEGDQPLVYIHGSNNLIPGLERELEGKSSGDSFEITIPPTEGYGERDEKKVISVSKDMFPSDQPVSAGTSYESEDNEGNPITIKVVEVNDKEVKVDANHPLAGVNLHFAVAVKDIRDATSDELAHGHVHGPGGHEH